MKPEPLSIERQSLVQCLHELSLVKGSQLIVNGFIGEEIDFHMFKVILKYCYYLFGSLQMYVYI